jgi:ankyrin repeat protein
MLSAPSLSHGGPDCPCRTSSVRLSVWTAASFGDVARLEHLLAVHHSSPCKEDEHGKTPLHYAAQHGREAAVQFLLQAGANAGAAACGCLALHRAAYQGHLRVCQALLRAGSPVDMADRSTGDGRTPLQKACANGHVAVVQVLLAAGASRSAVDARGATALQLAQAGGHAEVVRLLLESDAGR